jgi:hypothetical protein
MPGPFIDEQPWPSCPKSNRVEIEASQESAGAPVPAAEPDRSAVPGDGTRAGEHLMARSGSNAQPLRISCVSLGRRCVGLAVSRDP